MRKLLVFQHVPFEPLGTLDPMFREAGFRIRYVNFHRNGEVRVPVERYHGLVVLGGPMSADESDRHPHLDFEQDAIRRAIEREMPILGICLGSQLIARSLGARTLRGKAVEYGWTRVTPTRDGQADPLFRHFDGSEPIFQWHSDTFTLPAGAVHLARSDACAYQAFRVGEHAYGVQFHLEADPALIRRWVSFCHDVPAIASRAVPFDPEETLRIRRGTRSGRVNSHDRCSVSSSNASFAFAGAGCCRRVEPASQQQRSDNRSDLPSVDFAETVWSASFPMRW